MENTLDLVEGAISRAKKKKSFLYIKKKEKKKKKKSKILHVNSLIGADP